MTHSGLCAPQRGPRGLRGPRWGATIWVSRAQRTPQALIPSAITVADFIQIRFFRSLLVLNLLRQDTTVKAGVAIRHRKAGRNLAYMEQVLGLA